MKRLWKASSIRKLNLSLRKKNIRLFYKLMLSFILIFFILFVLLIGVQRIVNSKFDNYFIEKNNERINEIVDLISNSAQTSDNMHKLEDDLKRIVDSTGTSITIESLNKEILFSYKTSPKLPAFPKLPTQRRPELFSSSNFHGRSYTEKRYTINYGNQSAILKIGFFGKNLTSRDSLFFNNIIRINQYLMIILIVVGLFISFILSRGITRPIDKIIKTASDITKGNLESRTNIRSNTYEIVQLSDTINYMADTLDKQDMLRKQVTSDMAHEIRTPLTTLRNFMEAFIDDVWEPDKEKLEKCYNEILRLTNLVDKLKDIAKLEETNLVVDNTCFDLSLELENIISLFHPQFIRKSINLSTEIDHNIDVIMDKNKFTQIVTNLLSNAFRYTEQSGTVSVKLYIADSFINLIVKDNGIGISQEDMAFIYERFYRTDKSRNRETGGLGIGLTIVKKLINLYNGTIDVTSELGKGSEFTVRFPLESVQSFN